MTPSARRRICALDGGVRAAPLNRTKASPRSGEFARYVPQYRELPVAQAFSPLNEVPDLKAHLWLFEGVRHRSAVSPL